MSAEPIRIEQHLRRLGAQRDGIYPFGPEGPMAWQDQGIYTLTWDRPGPELDGPERSGPMVEFDYITTDRYGETRAEVAVYWSDPADPLAMLRTTVPLVSLTGRDRLVAALEKRTNGLELDWRRMLDQACRWALEQYRRGDPGILLRDAPELPPGADALTNPPLIESDGLSILFGDGGSLKSWTALALAASLQAGDSAIGGVTVRESRRVGYLDWEWNARRHRRRLEALAGHDLPEVAYLRCSRPLHDERDRLRRFVRDYRLDYLIVDSVGLACGGEPESAEVANRFVNGLAELVPAGLGIAHVNRSDASKAQADRPFGSAYWHNSARRTWYARTVSEVGSSIALVGLYNRKVNDGPLAQPLVLSYDFGGEGVTITRGNVADVPELDAARSTTARMRDLLGRDGAMELHVVAEQLNAKADTVKKAAQRGEAAGMFVRFPGPDGVYRWALKAKE